MVVEFAKGEPCVVTNGPCKWKKGTVKKYTVKLLKECCSLIDFYRETIELSGNLAVLVTKRGKWAVHLEDESSNCQK